MREATAKAPSCWMWSWASCLYWAARSPAVHSSVLKVPVHWNTVEIQTFHSSLQRNSMIAFIIALTASSDSKVCKNLQNYSDLHSLQASLTRTKVTLMAWLQNVFIAEISRVLPWKCIHILPSTAKASRHTFEFERPALITIHSKEFWNRLATK